MTAQEIINFVNNELNSFDVMNSRPFRVAVSSSYNGGDYPYGSHTEVREYADTTMGYAYSYKEAQKMLFLAAFEAERQNMQYRHAEEEAALNDAEDDILDSIACDTVGGFEHHGNKLIIKYASFCQAYVSSIEGGDWTETFGSMEDDMLPTE